LEDAIFFKEKLQTLLNSEQQKGTGCASEQRLASKLRAAHFYRAAIAH
jgi:hypothetical protein